MTSNSVKAEKKYSGGVNRKAELYLRAEAQDR
jgi:hypothetical protein